MKAKNVVFPIEFHCFLYSLGTQNCSLGAENCSPGTQICSPGTQHGVLEAGPGVLEAGLGGLERLLGAFKWSWAVPERSGSVPGGSRARNIDFSMVLGGLVGAHARAIPAGGFPDPLIP